AKHPRPRLPDGADAGHPPDSCGDLLQPARGPRPALGRSPRPRRGGPRMTVVAAEALELAATPRRGRDALALLVANKLALLGAFVTSCFVLVGVTGAVVVLTPGLKHLYLDQDLIAALKPPLSSGHL